MRIPTVVREPCQQSQLSGAAGGGFAGSLWPGGQRSDCDPAGEHVRDTNAPSSAAFYKLAVE